MNDAICSGSGVRQPVSILSFCLALLLISTCAFTATSFAAPVQESEPNETSFTANGPLLGDGILLTKNTSNDVDVVFAYLLPQQQVTISLRSLNYCSYNSYNEVRIRATDAQGRVHLESMRLGAKFESDEYGDYTWTTPSVPVRLEMTAGPDVSVGCDLHFHVSPALAQFPGPLASGVIISRNVKKGRKLVGQVSGVTGSVSFKFVRRGFRTKQLTAILNGNLAQVSTKSLRPGSYLVTMLHNGTKLNSKRVRIRK